MIPYSGTCEHTRKIRRVTAVHRIFWLKGTFGGATQQDSTKLGAKCIPFDLVTKLLEELEGKARRDLKTELWSVGEI